MYNTKLVITAFVCVSILACKKNSTTPPPVKKQETPLQNLVTTKFIDSVTIMNNGNFEIGYRFSSNKNGHITKLGCYMPDGLTYRVALWDSTTKNLIVAVSVKVTDSTKFTYTDISPIPIVANKKYVVSINNTVGGSNRNYFILRRKTPNTLTFPLTNASIMIEAQQEFSCSTLCFPQNAYTNGYLTGVPDFVFEPDN